MPAPYCFLVPLGKAYKKEMVNYPRTGLKFTMDKERKAFYWNFLENEVEPHRGLPAQEESLLLGTLSLA